MPAPKEPDVDNVIKAFELRGGENRGVHRLAEKLQPGCGNAPYPTVANCLLILAHDPSLAGMLGFNEFTGQHLLMRAPPVSEEGDTKQPGPYPRVWVQADVALILAYVQRIYCNKMNKSSLEDAMMAEAGRLRFHPVRNWLTTLRWDGQSRLDTWLHYAFGAPRDEYHADVGTKFMIACVRRIMQPGCKWDCMPVLEGAQGIGKSRACRELFGAEWFSDSMHPDFASRDAPISLVGAWGVELGEVQQIIRNEVEVFKAFLSRSVDRYRPVNGKFVIDVPRQSVLIGTTNIDDYLRDTSGNRRIWPVRCLHSDVEWIAVNRDHLWAEAVLRERSGESLWLTDTSTRETAEEKQADRIQEEVWTDKITDYLGFSQRVRLSDVMSSGLQLSSAQQDKKAQGRVVDVLKRLGWKVKVVREGKATPRFWFHPNHPECPP